MLRVPDTTDHLPREATRVANTQAGQQAEQQARDTPWKCSKYFGKEGQPSAGPTE